MAASHKAASTPAPVAPHFSTAGLRFLRGLVRNNDREWFNARKTVYEDEIKRPMLAVIERVTGAMMDFAPGHMRAPERILLRIYRDTRFSNDKRPYKQHVAAWWLLDGLAKTSGAGFYMHVSGKEVVMAAGAFMPDASQMLRIRRHLLEHHEEYRRIRKARSLTNRMPDDESGQPLVRSPKGFPADHPAADLFRQKRWGCGVTLAAEAATEAAFAQCVADHFRAAGPLVAFLNAPLFMREERPRRPLF